MGLFLINSLFDAAMNNDETALRALVPLAFKDTCLRSGEFFSRANDFMYQLLVFENLKPHIANTLLAETGLIKALCGERKNSFELTFLAFWNGNVQCVKQLIKHGSLKDAEKPEFLKWLEHSASCLHNSHACTWEINLRRIVRAVSFSPDPDIFKAFISGIAYSGWIKGRELKMLFRAFSKLGFKDADCFYRCCSNDKDIRVIIDNLYGIKLKPGCWLYNESRYV